VHAYVAIASSRPPAAIAARLLGASDLRTVRETYHRARQIIEGRIALGIRATMRGDGGEPFYRVLWRLKPELKSRCVLVMAAEAVPASAPQSKLPRVLERPVTRDAIGRIVEAFAPSHEVVRNRST
jgi:hypothetical protein